MAGYRQWRRAGSEIEELEVSKALSENCGMQGPWMPAGLCLLALSDGRGQGGACIEWMWVVVNICLPAANVDCCGSK